MKHVMIDLETLSTNRDAAILSIGAVVFNPLTSEIGSTFYGKVDLGRSKFPGVIDASTVEWWLVQSTEARAAILTGPRESLEDVLTSFGTWVYETLGGTQKSSFRLWSNGPTFDEMILRDAYLRYDWGFPFHFRSSRCCRTLVDIVRNAGFDFRKLPENELKHDALADAIYQAQGVCAAYKHLGLSTETI